MHVKAGTVVNETMLNKEIYYNYQSLLQQTLLTDIIFTETNIKQSILIPGLIKVQRRLAVEANGAKLPCSREKHSNIHLRTQIRIWYRELTSVPVQPSIHLYDTGGANNQHLVQVQKFTIDSQYGRECLSKQQTAKYISYSLLIMKLL